MVKWLIIALVIYIVAAVFAVVLLWRNSDAPDALQNAGILVAGILPAVIAILPYLKTNKDSLGYTYAIFFDEGNRRAVWSGIYDPYSRAYSHVFTNLGVAGVTSREISAEEFQANNTNEYWPIFHYDRGLDLIERAILVKLEDMFRYGWDTDPKTAQTPVGIETRWSINTEKGERIAESDLIRIFQHNDLAAQPGRLSGFVLPPDSVLQSKPTGKKAFSQRNIIINNNDVFLKINIIPSRGTVAPGGIWGVMNPHPELKALLYRVIVEVNLPYGLNRKTSRYEQWFRNITMTLEELDWTRIDGEVEKSLFRKMLTQPAN